MGLPDSLLFRTLWDIAELEKRLRRDEAAVAALADLAASPNPFRVRAAGGTREKIRAAGGKFRDGLGNDPQGDYPRGFS